MSRIILSRFDNGNNKFVVGWDHPANGAFWTEYASSAEIEYAKRELDKIEDGKVKADGNEINRLMMIVETSVKREGGMWPGIPLHALRGSIPEDLRELITDKVMSLLYKHKDNPNSGYTEDRIIDLTENK